MDPSRLMTQTGTLHHVAQDGARDEYNNATEGTPTTETVACLLQQRQRIEQTAQGQIATETLILFLPAGTDVDTLDYVTVDGNDYQIDGPPWAAYNPRSQAVSHIECTVRRTS